MTSPTECIEGLIGGQSGHNSSTSSGRVSITHEHILAVMSTELHEVPYGKMLRVLDVGCGSGSLIAFLHSQMKVRHPEYEIEFFGIDVNDHGVQRPGYFEKTISDLTSTAPEVEWANRLVCIKTTDPWPFAAGFFDIVISNQVCEHVNDHMAFFNENYRVLRPGGISFHLFPLVHYLYEGHLPMPLVHRFKSFHLLKGAIKLGSRLGFGIYRDHARLFNHDLKIFSERHADYLILYTNYLSTRALSGILKQCRLRHSFRYTSGFYTTKLRRVLGFAPSRSYNRSRNALWECFQFLALRYISSITLFLEKDDSCQRLRPAEQIGEHH